MPKDTSGFPMHKIRISTKITGKKPKDDVPSWALGKVPFVGESGKDFAKRLLDMKYGEGNYKKGANSEYSKLQKYADKHFKDPDDKKGNRKK